MAKGVIEERDVVGDLTNIRRRIAVEMEEGIKSVEKFKAAAKQLSALSLSVGGSENEKKLNASLKERAGLQKILITNEKAIAQADIQIIKLSKEKENLQKRSNKRTIEETTYVNSLKAAERQRVKEMLAINGAYLKLNRQRTEAQKTLQNLLSAENKNTSAIKRANAEYQKLNKRVLAVDKATDNYSKNIGNYGSALGNVTGIVRNLGSALGFAGGIFAGVQVFRNAIDDIREFEKANATLSGVLQQTKLETKELTQDAIRLGESTVKTAKEVSGLQLAYARLGFSQQEILDLSKATISGSIALNSSLDETATLVGAVVNSYDDLSSTDAANVIDQLSLSTAKSALDFQKLSTTLPIVLGAANALNVPLSEVLGTLSKTADSGIEASTAATSLRNIYIESAARGIDYKDALEEVRNSTDKLSTANELFGKRAAVSALVIANNTEGVDLLTESYENAAGTAERMANNELDTLDGALKLLNSAWQGYILNTAEANDISGTFKDSVKFLADNLAEILDGLIFLVKAFVIYKASILGANIATRLYNIGTKLMASSSVNAAKGVNTATFSVKSFNTALKANAIGLAVTALFFLYEAFKRLNIPISEVAKNVEESNKEFLETSKRTVDSSRSLRGLADRYDELTKIVEPNKKQQAELNAIIKQIAKDVPEAVKEFDKYGNALDVNTAKVREFNKANNDNDLAIARIELEELQNVQGSLLSEQNKFTQAIDNGNKAFIKGFGAVRIENGKLLKEIQTNQINSLTGTVTTTTKIVELSKTEEKALREKRNEINALIEANKSSIASNIDRQAQLAGFTTVSEQQTRDAIKGEKEKAQAIKDSGETAKTREEREQSIFALAKFRLEEIIRLRSEEANNQELTSAARLVSLAKQEEAEIKLAILERDFSKLSAKNNVDLQLSNEEYASNKISIIEDTAETVEQISEQETEKLIANQKKVLDEQLKGLDQLETFSNTDENDEITEVNNEFLNSEVQDTEERERKIAEIKARYLKQNLEAQINGLEEILSNDTKVGEKRADLEKDLSKLRKDLSDVNVETSEDESEKLLEFVDKYGQQFADISYALLDLTNSIFDARIENIDNEIAKNEEYYDNQIELAGDDERQKEALENEREKRTEKLEAKRREEQRKQAVVNKVAALAEIAIQTALSVMRVTAQTGVAAPLLIPSIIALGALQAATVLATPIPQYEKGTQGKPHKGGLAEVAEKRPEVIREPGKRPYIVQNRSFLNLPKGTEVDPSIEAFRKGNHYSEIKRLGRASEGNTTVSNIIDNTEVVNELKATRKQLSKQKTPINRIIIQSDNNSPKKGWNAN